MRGNPKHRGTHPVSSGAPRKEVQVRKTSSSPQLHAASAAVAEALESTSSGRTAARPDTYGKGTPTDRLQFGYAPAIAEEAMGYHERVPVSTWREERRRIGRLVFVRHQRNPTPHCEPIAAVLKLRQHWKKQSQWQAEYRAEAGSAGRVDSEKLDGLLEMLASKQRVA